MDIRSILNKLDAVVLAENITLQDIETAVKGKENDEQARAEILNDLAWKNKLPGLYDPVSGGFVGKQSVPQGMGGEGRYNIGGTASERADRALADLGLIPDNAKTSTALGRMFRGDEKDQYSQDIKTRSQGVVTKRKIEKFKTDTLPKLKDLVTKLNSTVSAVKSGSSLSQSSGIGLKLPSKPFESTIFESLLKEFQDEVIDQDIEERVVGVDSPGAKLAPEVQQVYDELKALLDTAEKDGIGKDPEMAKELEAAKTAMATAEKDGVEKPAAAPATPGSATTTSTSGGTQDGEKKPSPYDLTSPEEKKKFPVDYNKDGTDKSKEERLARVKELLAKAKEPKKAVPMVSPKTESMSELIARIQSIAEGTNELQEALTAAEYKELQTYAAGLKTDFANDPEIQALTQQALALPAQFSSDEKPTTTTTTTDPTNPVNPNKPKPGSDPRVQKVQEQLKALGIDPGPIDGRIGPKTEAGIKAFEKLAGLPETGKITPELEKLLADGKNVIARSKLTQSLTAIETILTKYKISESVTSEDLETMTEAELRAFVMSNIKMFSESDQMSIMKQYIEEASAFDRMAGDPLPSVMRADGKTWEKVPGVPDQYYNRANPAEKMTGPEIEKRRKLGPGGSTTPPVAPDPGVNKKLSWLDKARGVIARNPKTAKVAAVITAAAALYGGGKLWNWFKDSGIEMDPADLAELQKHLKVLDEYGKNPEIIKGLPADVQARLQAVLGKLDKLQKIKAKPAAPAA